MQSELGSSLGLSMLMFYGAGTRAGAGFYALLRSVAGDAGRAAPAAFLLAIAFAPMTAAEVRDPRRTLPLAILGALAISTAL